VSTLGQKIERMMLHHPLRDQPRSGDKQDGELSVHGDAGDDGAMFKTPAGRRRQMMAMCYCNLFTGPIVTLVTLAFLWCYMPYRTYIFCAYLAWMLFDNRERAYHTGARDRVKQWWRHSVMYTLFRDYFPIRLIKGTI